MGIVPVYAVSELEIAGHGRNLRLHRPASNAADGNLEAGERHSNANRRNLRCISGSTALSLHSETFSQLGRVPVNLSARPASDLTPIMVAGGPPFLKIRISGFPKT